MDKLTALSIENAKLREEIAKLEQERDLTFYNHIAGITNILRAASEENKFVTFPPQTAKVLLKYLTEVK